MKTSSPFDPSASGGCAPDVTGALSGDAPKPQQGTWTLTAPDGRTWQAESPMRCLSVEQRERVPAEVALQRILQAAAAVPTEEWELRVNTLLDNLLTAARRDGLLRQIKLEPEARIELLDYIDSALTNAREIVDAAIRNERRAYFGHNPSNTWLAQSFNNLLMANGTFEYGMAANARREAAASLAAETSAGNDRAHAETKSED